MKLYATVTSERATKSQGGQKYVQANLTVDRTHVISITLKAEGEDVEVWETPAKGSPILLKTIKGKRQKGECLHDWDSYGKCAMCGLWDTKGERL